MNVQLATKYLALLCLFLGCLLPKVSPAASTPKHWISGTHFQRLKGPLRLMLGKARSIYIGKNGYFDARLRWHSLPPEFSDTTIMRKANVLAIYRGGRSLAHRINLRLATRLSRRYHNTLLKHMFTHTGGRMFFGRDGTPQIKIAGATLPYPTHELQLPRLLQTFRKHFSQQPAQKWPHTMKMLQRAKALVSKMRGKSYEKSLDKAAFFFYVFHAMYSAVTRDKELLQSPRFNRTKAAMMTYATPIKVRQSLAQRPQAKYAFSLVYFWRNDLDWYCRKQLRRGVALGFRKVAFFYPVHYTVFRRNGTGSDFKIVSLAGVPQRELNRCLRRILLAGLDLHFIPHLEDTKTIISNWEVEWRINGGVPLDARYYKHAFLPLLRFLKQHKGLVKRWSQRARLRVTVAAELDRMVFAKPKVFGQTTKRLKVALKQVMGRRVPLIWNPNGDLAAVIGDAKQRKPPATRCSELAEAFQHIDGIAPTIYERYGHLGQITPNRGLFVATRDKFLTWLARATKRTCPKARDYQRLQAQWSRLVAQDFSFGELALDPRRPHSYANLHSDFLRHGGSEMILWTTNQWDPVGITHRHIPNQTHFREILQTLKP